MARSFRRLGCLKIEISKIYYTAIPGKSNPKSAGQSRMRVQSLVGDCFFMGDVL
jgi:hypothetical protein